MKTKITFIIAFAILLLSQIVAQTVELKPNYNDAYVSYDGATGTYAVNAFGEMLLINNGTGTTPTTTKLNSAVMNFLLPAIPSGTSLISATFSATSMRKDTWVNYNADLYGINFRATDLAINSDYYSGPFTAGANVANGSDWGIMDNFFSTTDPSNASGVMITTKTTDAAANAQLLSFVQKQFTDGGVFKYAFLRLSMDNLAATAWQRYSVASEATATYYPKLTLVFSLGTSVEIIAGSKVICYANQQGNIVVEGEKLDGKVLNIYSVNGKQIVSENMNNNFFTSRTLLKTGSYIVKINNVEGKNFSQLILVK